MKVNIVLSITFATSTGLNIYEVALCNLKLNFDTKKEIQKSEPLMN